MGEDRRSILLDKGPYGNALSDQSDEVQIAENVRLLRLIREDPAWALARVQRAAELEARLASDEGER